MCPRFLSGKRVNRQAAQLLFANQAGFPAASASLKLYSRHNSVQRMRIGFHLGDHGFGVVEMAERLPATLKCFPRHKAQFRVKRGHADARRVKASIGSCAGEFSQGIFEFAYVGGLFFPGCIGNGVLHSLEQIMLDMFRVELGHVLEAHVFFGEMPQTVPCILAVAGISLRVQAGSVGKRLAVGCISLLVEQGAGCILFFVSAVSRPEDAGFLENTVNLIVHAAAQARTSCYGHNTAGLLG